MAHDYTFSILALAGLAALWRSLLADHPTLKLWLAAYVPRIKPSLTCGTCFTYWISLAFVLLFDPLHGWLPPSRILLPQWLEWLLALGLAWMAVSIGALIVRFAYAMLEEYLWYAVHKLRGLHHH